MKKILLVKMTSMGDLIQSFPALTDAAKAIPGLKFDWLADESFQDIPRLHYAVDKVISLSLRRWKKNLKQCLFSGEIKQFLRELQSQNYDMVIDAQSNIKSAIVTALCKGTKYGLDKTSVREFGAHWAYHKKTTISRDQNHALRIRRLMAAALEYELPLENIDYGIQREVLIDPDYPLPEKFIFITAISSAKERLWPEPYWHETLQDLIRSGYEIVLPWWSIEEKERILRIKQENPCIHMLAPMNLIQKAAVLSKARAAISLDTGLAHMAASLNVPNVSLYGPTDAKLTGTYGHKQIHISAKEPTCAPCLKNQCSYSGESTLKPACMESIKPKEVLNALYSLV